MKIKNVTLYEVTSAFTIFNKLFLPEDKIFISSDFRNKNSSIDWRSVFNVDRNYLGDMNSEYYWTLTKGYIKNII